MKTLPQLEADKKGYELMATYWLKLRQEAKTIEDSEYASEQAKRWSDEWDGAERMIQLEKKVNA